MKNRELSIRVDSEQVAALIKKGTISILETVADNLSKKATYVNSLIYVHDDGNFYIPTYKKTDIVSIREPFIIENGVVRYKADHPDESNTWKPSVNMKPEYARLNATVTDVYAIRLHDMKKKDFILAGFKNKDDFVEWWDGCVRKNIRVGKGRKEKMELFGWNANPMVWVYVLERNE